MCMWNAYILCVGLTLCLISYGRPEEIMHALLHMCVDLRKLQVNVHEDSDFIISTFQEHCTPDVGYNLIISTKQQGGDVGSLR